MKRNEINGNGWNPMEFNGNQWKWTKTNEKEWKSMGMDAIP